MPDETRINERFLAAIAAPGGAYMSDLSELTDDVAGERDKLAAAGMASQVGVGPGGKEYCYLIAQKPEPRKGRAEKIEAAIPSPGKAEPAAPEGLTIGGDPTPEKIAYPGVDEELPNGTKARPAAPPPSPPAPAEAPRSTVNLYEVGPVPSMGQTGCPFCKITVSDFRVQTGLGGLKIVMKASSEEDAHLALDFSLGRPKGAPIDVYLVARRKIEINAKPPAAVEREAQKKMDADRNAPLRVIDAENKRHNAILEYGVRPDGSPNYPKVAIETPEPKKEVQAVPIFEYECRDCTTHFEELIQVGGEAPKCPKCASVNLLKLPSKISSASRVVENEKDPEKKSRQQLSREIDEQIRDGEISPALADAQGRLASL